MSAERVGELHPGHANLVGRHAVEHEGVVGVGTVGDSDFASVFSGIAGHKSAVTRELPEVRDYRLREITANDAASTSCGADERAAAAAIITFDTSAKKNGYSPKNAACRQLWVIIASQPMPAANSTTSAAIAASQIAQRSWAGRARRSSRPGTRPPDMPTDIRRSAPAFERCRPGPTEAKTGRPIAPHARYSAAAANPRRLPRVSPTSSTPNWPASAAPA